MKHTLLLIRHAKSSWANPLQSDFERPLNERGKQDAPEMGKKLKKHGVVPDLIIASSAKRTRQTAKRIAKELDYDAGKIIWEEKLYHCIPSVFEEIIHGIDSRVKTVIIVGHNPGITGFANQLSPDFEVDNLPTCAVVGVHVDADDWSDFSIAKRKVFLFEYPSKDDNA
jgi:phosphohistidine phosphatase